MRKGIIIFIIFVGIFTVNMLGILANDIPRTELVKQANNEIKQSGIITWDYFGTVNIAPTPKPLSTSEYLSGERNLIVYGEPYNFDNATGRNRYLGYTMQDTPFTNYLFRNDVTSSTGLWDRIWVPNPKYDSKTLNRPEVQGTDIFNNRPEYEESIRLGLKLISRKNPDGSLLDFPEDKLNAREWNKYVHVYQPPTSVSWGCGIMFHNPYGNQINYLTVPMSPEGFRGDLSAQFDPIPSSVAEGDEVLVGINIQSTFDTELTNVPFKWEITKKNGEPLSATFAGHAAVGEGNIDKIPEKGERMLYAYFKMPDSDVNIKFEINKDGKTPTEVLLDNNVLDSGDSIKVVSELPPTVGQFDLDYNVLTRKVDFPLASADIEAQLILPKGSWNGNARGELDVTNKTSDLFRSFNVTNNPAVNEASSRIVRKPQIHTTLQRSDFGDKPQNGNYLDWSTPWEPKTKSGSVTFSGLVSRPYKYTYYCSDEDCKGHTGHSSTSAAFNSGKNTRTIRTFIYNGKQLVTPKAFENKIDYNTIYYLQKNLWWTSEPYKLNVVRWMCHQDEDDSLYGWTTVPGKYQRTFTQQNSAEIKWVATNTMEKAYQRSREAARSRDYRKSEYDKAVFASDIDFKNVDYPIKSGYYFNPAGTYTFDVETVTYKITKADTKDHKDLVDAAIKSFRYESDLMYINSYKEPVNIQNELLPKSGNSYSFGMIRLDKAIRESRTLSSN